MAKETKTVGAATEHTESTAQLVACWQTVQGKARKAVEATIVARGSEAIPVLDALVDHADAEVQKAVIPLLAALARQGVDVYPQLARTLVSQHYAVFQATLKVLDKLPLDPVHILPNLFHRPNVKAAIRYIKRYGTAAVSALDQWFHRYYRPEKPDEPDGEPPWRVKRAGESTLNILRQLDIPLEGPALQMVRECIRDERLALHVQALRCVATMTPPGEIEELLNDVLERLKRGNAFADQALARLGKQALPQVFQHLMDTRTGERSYVIKAVGRMGTAGMEYLCDTLKDEDISLATAAATALGKIGVRDGKVIEALGVAALSWRGRLPHAARQALEALGAPIPSDPWQECPLHPSVIYQLARLGCTYAMPATVAPMNAGGKPVPAPILALLEGVHWPANVRYRSRDKVWLEDKELEMGAVSIMDFDSLDTVCPTLLHVPTARLGRTVDHIHEVAIVIEGRRNNPRNPQVYYWDCMEPTDDICIAMGRLASFLGKLLVP